MLCCGVGIRGGGGVNVVGGGVEELPPSDGFVVWLALPFAMEAKMVAMVMQSFCGQVSTFQSGGGRCSVTGRPRRGAKSGGQQQQRSKRWPTSSWMERSWSYEAPEGISSEIGGGNKELFGGERKFCGGVKDNMQLQSIARNTTGYLRSTRHTTSVGLPSLPNPPNRRTEETKVIAERKFWRKKAESKQAR